MDVRSFSPLRATTLVWQSRPGTWALTVICKATFVLKPGEATPAPEQEEINESDDHWNDDVSRSVRTPCDLAPAKPRADVTLVGHAFVPGRAQTRRLMTRLIVGEIDKSIEVACDRVIGADGTIQEGARFHRMALGYERAAGGPGTPNPTGMRLDARDMYARRALPNLQRPDAHISSIDETIESVGYGPLGARWPNRLRFIGNDPNNIPDLKSPVLSERFELTYYNHAPEDQQLATLRENERIVLENLHPDHPRLVTNLSGLRPAVFIQNGRLHRHRVNMRADTLWIDTDRALVTVTFRGQVPLVRPDEVGTVLVALQEGATPLSFVDMERLAAGSNANAAKPGPQERTVVGFEIPNPPTANSATPFGANNPWSEETMTAPAFAPLAGTVGAHAPAWLAQGAAAPNSAPAAQATPQAAPPHPPQPPAIPPQPPLTPPRAASVPPPPPAAMKPPPRPADFGAPPGSTPRSGAFTGQGVPPPPLVGTPTSRRAVPSAAPTWSPANTGETLGMKAAAAAATAAATASTDAQSGTVAASNAAAGAAPWDAVRRDRKLGADVEARVEPEEQTKEQLQLLYFDPKIPPRLRRVSRWKPVLDELEEAPPDRALDGADTGHDPSEIDDMREVFEIMAHGERTDARGLDELLRRATRDDGKFLPPLALVTGELEVCFDERATLKAAIALSSPLVAPTDEALKSAITSAREWLTLDPDLPPTVSEAAMKRIHEAFVREKKTLTPEHLDAQMDRVLLTARAYQKRSLFGDEFVRTLLRQPGSEAPAIVYLPADAAKKLPLFRRFRVRLIVEIHPVQDASETRPAALRTYALARSTSVPTNG